VRAFVMCAVAVFLAFGASFAIPQRGRVYDPHEAAMAESATA
jgi:hypothetical protein